MSDLADILPPNHECGSMLNTKHSLVSAFIPRCIIKRQQQQFIFLRYLPLFVWQAAHHKPHAYAPDPAILTRAADCFVHSLSAGFALWRHKGRHMSRHCCRDVGNVTFAWFSTTLVWIEAKYRLYERELMNKSCRENYFIYFWINEIKNKHCRHPNSRMKSTHSFLHFRQM